ncbi:DUF1361 domain-containing protein [Mariniflexile jejuense]|uniref:DUF1361 domain-containing protein n=1 Tax=Mariniflexile jejuense TaxID=1173582 RepID=A0ABW3JLP6_9FLAO
MYQIKQLFNNQFKTFTLVSVSMLLSLVLLIIRIKLSHSLFYIFLVWNLFLAFIPFAITTYLMQKQKSNKLVLLLWFSIWLLFLPNAPYIITDLVHLRLNTNGYLWLDILVVSAFACNGILLFYLSILDMKSVLQNHFKNYVVNYTILFTCFLSGFGVYLGRFLRYNSWEILSNPKYLFFDIANIITKPQFNKEAWLFTFLFGIFLSIGFWVFKNLIVYTKN